MARAEKPKIDLKSLKKNIGKFLLDMAKITFGSFLLGSIVKGEVPQCVLLIAGGVVFAACVVIGLLFTARRLKG